MADVKIPVEFESTNNEKFAKDFAGKAKEAFEKAINDAIKNGISKGFYEALRKIQKSRSTSGTMSIAEELGQEARLTLELVSEYYKDKSPVATKFLKQHFNSISGLAGKYETISPEATRLKNLAASVYETISSENAAYKKNIKETARQVREKEKKEAQDKERKARDRKRLEEKRLDLEWWESAFSEEVDTAFDNMPYDNSIDIAESSARVREAGNQRRRAARRIGSVENVLATAADVRSSITGLNNSLMWGRFNREATNLENIASEIINNPPKTGAEKIKANARYSEAKNKVLSYARKALTPEVRDAYIGGVSELTYQIKELTRTVKETTKSGGFLSKLSSYVAAGATGIAAGTYLSNFARDFYSNRTDSYTQAIHKVQSLTKKGMGVGGAAIGGILGSMLGPLGTVVGAGIGGFAGSLFGGSYERRQAALESSFTDVIDAEKWRALYGNNRVGNWHFAKQAQAAGFVSVGDMMSLQSKQNVFMPSAAFGEISDDQWLALSMMPHYFATMVSGADQAAQLKALQRDYSALGPGFGEFFSRKLGISENIRAWAASGRLGGLDRDIEIAKTMEAELYGRESEIYSKRHGQQVKDVLARRWAWDEVESRPLLLGEKEFERNKQRAEDIFTKRDLTIVIDGVSVNTNIPIYTDDRELSSDKQIENVVGSSL